MIKRKAAYALVGGLLVTGLVFNAPSMATYVQNLGTATQTINAATWDVQFGHNLGTHTIFPKDVVSSDTITLINKNNYPVKYTIELTNEGDVAFNNALSLNVTDGTNSYTEKSGTGEVTLGEGRTLTLNSNVTWNPTGNDTQHAGKQVKYNYNITAEKAQDDVIPEVSPILEDVSAKWTGEQIRTTFKINESLDLSLSSDDDVRISYLKENGEAMFFQTKDKTWDGFLNNNNGQGFCQGIKGDEQYSNDIEPDTYRNFTNAKESNTFKKASYVKVTVKKDGVEYSKTVKISNK